MTTRTISRLAACVASFSVIPLLAQEIRRPKLVVTDTNGIVTTLQPTAGLNDGTDDGSATKGKDAMAWTQWGSGNNWGAFAHCYVMSDSCNAATGYAYLQFSLAGMPTANIAKAQIQIYMVVRAMPGLNPWGLDPVFALRQVTGGWNEMTLTYNLQPTFDSPIIASQTVTGVAGVWGVWVENWLSFDITDLYKSWVSGTAPNYGVRINHENTFGCLNGPLAYLYTSDYGLTKLTYTGPTAGNHGDPATVSAKLEDVGYAGYYGIFPVAGKQVSFSVGAQNCTGTTDINGQASCSVTPLGTGTQTIAVSFAGDTQYQASTATAQFQISGGVTDITPPVITPTIMGTQGANGWYISDVTVSWSVTDPESGITSSVGCTTAQLSASASLLCTAVNGASLTASYPITIKIDKTPPVIADPVITGTTGANGWYTSAVTVTFDTSDPESGIMTPACSTTLNTDTAGTVVTCNATNGAGLSSSRSVTIKIDSTPPVIPAPTITGTLGTGGWYSSIVTVSWNANDPQSGITTPCAGASLSTNTSGTVVTCTATNGAGLTSSNSVTIKIDASRPAITGMPPANCSIWPPNKKMVEVATISASGGLSGLSSFNVTATSNEPADPGPDIIITGTGLQPRTVQLRADRLGNGNGRIYTITATSASGAGATSTSVATCTVPHDQGK